MSYSSRLIATVVALNIIVASLASSSLYMSHADHERIAEISTHNLARLIVRDIGSQFSAADQFLLLISDEYSICPQVSEKNSSCPSIEALLRRQGARHPELINVQILDSRGKIRFSPNIPFSLTGRAVDVPPFFKKHREQRSSGLLISNPIAEDTPDSWRIAFSRRLEYPDGRFAGVVAVYLSLNQFEERFAALRLGQYGLITLRSDKLRLLARYPQAAGQRGTPNSEIISPPFREALQLNPASGSFLSGESSIDGIPRLHSYVRHPSYDFYVSVSAAKKEYLSEWQTAAVLVTFLFIAFAAMSACGTRVLVGFWKRRERMQLALQKSERLFKESQRVAGIGSYEIEIVSGQCETSEKLRQILGIPPETVLNMNQADRLVHPNDLPELIASFDAIKTGKNREFEISFRITRPTDGAVRWVLAIGESVINAGHAPSSIIGTLQDITERRETVAHLQLAASVFTHAREGIVITDPDGKIIDVNTTFSEITGYSREEAIGSSPRILKSEKQPPAFYTDLWNDLIDKGYWSGEIWNRKKNGDIYPELLTISAVRDSDGKTQNYVALFNDITPAKEYEQRLEFIAHHDILTGLPNRLLLTDRLQQAIHQSARQGQALAVLYIDLDGFKAINDQHSHDAGDRLLTVLAQRMKDAIRDGDTLARLGGDEFVAVLTDFDTEDCYIPVLERLLQACEAPVNIESHALCVSASIGVALYPSNGSDADLLIRRADQSMYAAKRSGKNRFHLFSQHENP